MKQILSIPYNNFIKNNYWQPAFKIFSAFAAVWFLTSHHQIKELPRFDSSLEFKELLILLFLSLGNWGLEIKKWQKLVQTIERINYFEALRQSLISFAASLITPNRIGEYGAKILFYPSAKSKKIFLLNLKGNFLQLLTTVLFGINAVFILMIFYKHQWQKFSLPSSFFFVFIILTAILIAIGFFLKKKFQNKEDFLDCPCKKIFILSISRYLLFSFQFALIWTIFHRENLKPELFLAINLTYLMASLIPVLSFFDWAVKGSAAVYVFSLLELPATHMLSVTGLMWLLNFSLPFILGTGLFLSSKLRKNA